MIEVGDIRNGSLAGIAAGSIDACITDPPYELGFMGKAWDRSGVAFDPEAWAEVYRVLKPGAHLAAFGGTRTFHRMTVAIEDAGFDIRDCLSWLYGSGFPKSRDIGKAIDTEAGRQREAIGTRSKVYGDNPDSGSNGSVITGKIDTTTYGNYGESNVITAPASPESEQWEGWGTALKPAWEPIILARKPIDQKTVAANVLEHGTGAIHIDACRIGFDATDAIHAKNPHTYGTIGSQCIYGDGVATRYEIPSGRWPANACLDEEAGEMLDDQSGERGAFAKAGNRSDMRGGNFNSENAATQPAPNSPFYGDTGGASRFFYCAKASQAERNAGLAEKNAHPTVKPVNLMRWLCRLLCPVGGIILDPFVGSGTTGIAAALERMQFDGRDSDPASVDIARDRVAYWSKALQGQLW